MARMCFNVVEFQRRIFRAVACSVAVVTHPKLKITSPKSVSHFTILMMTRMMLPIFSARSMRILLSLSFHYDDMGLHEMELDLLGEALRARDIEVVIFLNLKQ